MPDKKISELTQNLNPSYVSEIPIVQDGLNYRTTLEKAVINVVEDSTHLRTQSFGTAAFVNTGTGTTNVILGNDARLTNARTPVAHTHVGYDIVTPVEKAFCLVDGDDEETVLQFGAGSVFFNTSFYDYPTAFRQALDAAQEVHSHGNLTSDGRIGATAGRIVVTGAGGSLTTAATISAASVSGLAAVATTGLYSSLTGVPSTFTPNAHKANHATGGSDALTAADIGAAAAAHTHDASAVVSGQLNILQIPTGTSGSTVCIGNDSRLSDSRNPLAHASSHQPAGTDYVPQTFTTTASFANDQNNWNPGTKADVVRVSSSAAVAISGLLSSYGPNSVVLLNTGSNAITLRHNSASSSPGNRFLTATATDFSLVANGGCATLLYDASVSPSGAWRILEATPTGIIAVSSGGTGASDAAAARTNLGLGTIATASADSYLPTTGGNLTGGVTFTDVAGTAITSTNTATSSTATFSASSSGAIVSCVSSSTTQLNLSRFSADTAGGAALFTKLRGSVTTPAAVVGGDTLGNVAFLTRAVLQDGSLNANAQTFAQIRARVGSTPVAGQASVPTYMEFRISSSLGIADTSMILNPTTLDVSAASGNAMAVNAYSTLTGSASSAFSCFRARSNNAATSGGDTIGVFRAMGRNTASNYFEAGSIYWLQSAAANATGAVSQAVIAAHDGATTKPCITARHDSIEAVCHGTAGYIMPVAAVRAFIRFDGTTSTPAASFNCTFTQSAGPLYTINFTTAMPDGNYNFSVDQSFLTNAQYVSYEVVSISTTAIQIRFTSNLGYYAPGYVSITFFR